MNFSNRFQKKNLGTRVGSIPASDESPYRGFGYKQSRLRTVLAVVGETKMRQVSGGVPLMESSIATRNPFSNTHCQHTAPRCGGSGGSGIPKE